MDALGEGEPEDGESDRDDPRSTPVEKDGMCGAHANDHDENGLLVGAPRDVPTSRHARRCLTWTFHR